MIRKFSNGFILNRIFIRLFLFSVLSIPALVSAVMPMVSSGDGRISYTVGLKSDGTVVVWGECSALVLGSRIKVSDECSSGLQRRVEPVAVPGLNGVVAVSAGGDYIVALKSDGTVVTWGLNNGGQLGDGTVTTRYNPAPVPGLNGVIAVGAGFDHTVAAKSDGTVVAWGRNDVGQLGDGTKIDRYSPVVVSGLNGVVAISAGAGYTIALKSNGIWVAWGSCGISRPTCRPPRVLSGTNNVVAVATDRRDYFVRADGKVVTNQPSGGPDRPDWIREPLPGGGTIYVVPELNDAVAIATGGDSTLALRYNGTVKAWGRYSGDGTDELRDNPVPVPGLNGVVAVSTGPKRRVVLKSDGTVMEWGVFAYSPEPVRGLNLGAVKPASDARVFAYAEANYPRLFSGTGTEGRYQKYHYRYYAFSNTYLAVDTFGNIFIMGPSTKNVIVHVGSVMDYANAIRAWEKDALQEE